MENTGKKIILAIAFDEEKSQYSVDIPAGSSVAESAFAMAIVIKCLIKDNIIAKPEEVIDLINKYVTDPQYEEVE